MEYVRQYLDSLHEPGRRATEVRVRVHRPHSTVLHCRKVGPAGDFRQNAGLLHGSRHVEAAGHKDKNLRRRLEYFVPAENCGGLSSSGEELYAPASRTISGTQ